MINAQLDNTRGPQFRLTADDKVTACPFCSTTKLGYGVSPVGIRLVNDGHDYWIECSCGARMSGEARMLSCDADPLSDVMYTIHIAVARSALDRWNARL